MYNNQNVDDDNDIEKNSESSSELTQLFFELIADRHFNVVDDLLQEHPELLIEKQTWDNRYLRSGDEELTAFQAALRTHDFKMWPILVKHFDEIPDGDEKKVEQFNQEFPNGVEFPESKLNFADFIEALNESDYYMRYEIMQEASSDDIDFDAATGTMSRIISKTNREKYFNPNHLLKAYAVFQKEYSRTARYFDDSYDSGDENYYNTAAENDVFWEIVIKPLRMPSTYIFERDEWDFTILDNINLYRRHVNTVKNALKKLAEEINPRPQEDYEDEYYSDYSY